MWRFLSLLALTGMIASGETSRAASGIEGSVAVVRTPRGGGSAFVATLDGKTYIVTNQHVLMGTTAPDVHITFIDGTEAHPTKPEIIGDQDLARIEIETDRVPLKCAAGTPTIGTHVQAIGNSLGAGVLTKGEGVIKGVGDREIEVDCDFVPGNSGGPILDPTGSVLAVATYIKFGEKDATTAGTRYEKNRRFGVRLHDGMKWTPIANWPLYASTGAAIANAQLLGREIFLAAQAVVTNTDASTFKPHSQKVVSALADLQRIRLQLAEMSGGNIPRSQMKNYRDSLFTAYGTALRKLREACNDTISDVSRRPVPPEWGWLVTQEQQTVEDLQALQKILDSKVKEADAY